MKPSGSIVGGLILGVVGFAAACADQQQQVFGSENYFSSDAAVDGESDVDASVGDTDGGLNDAGADAAIADASVDANVGPAACTQSQVQAILNTNCMSCHGSAAAGGMNLSGDFLPVTLNVASKRHVRQGTTNSWVRIVPGNADNSLLYQKLIPAAGNNSQTNANVGSRMPMGGNPLTAADLDCIKSFINSLP